MRYNFDYFLRLENLMKGRENASIIDLKMGTNTMTREVLLSQKRMEKRMMKDQLTTS